MNKTKYSKKGKNIQDAFKDLFKVQDQNVHLYLDKLIKSSDQMKSVLFALNSIEKTLFNEECKESLKLSILDDQCIEQTEGLCDAIKAEVLQSTTVVTDVTILMYSKLKNQLNYDSVQQLANYFNGQLPNSMPHKIVQNVALLYQQFNDIESVKLEDLLTYFELKLEKTDNFNAFGLPFRDFLEQAIEEEDMQKKANKLKAVKISFQILFQQAKKWFDIQKIPEFDIQQLKSVITQAIQEFKKQLPGCDMAFKKLISSLDTFVDNFGNYYENFQVQGREPATFFFDFLDDVHKQYENADTNEYRTLIRQFNKIKQTFVKKLGGNLDNPMIKTLFTELQSQLDKAKVVLGDDDLEGEDAE